MGNKDLRIFALRDALKTAPVLSVKELADRFKVSEMTIRRDLAYLKDNRLLYDTNMVNANMVNTNQINTQDKYEAGYNYFDEQIKHLDKKERIARFAVTLIDIDDILILDSGTTTGELSRYIDNEQPLTVLCYNYHIFSQLYKKENLTLIFAGGYFHRRDLMFESNEGVDLIRRTRATKMFVSASGIHDKLGMTCAYPYETVTKRAAIDSALTKILVADSSKFGQIRPGYFARLNEMDVIVTDEELKPEWREMINALGITLHMV